MPTKAQDRVRRGPFGALLILLSLMLGSGAAAAAGNDLREPLARLAPARHGGATALLAAGNRNPLDDDATDTGGGPAVPECPPGLVAGRPWTRPLADGGPEVRIAAPRAEHSSYRARAPPAS